MRCPGAAMGWGQSCTTTAERVSTLWGLLHRSACPSGSGAATHHSVRRVSQWEGMHACEMQPLPPSYVVVCEVCGCMWEGHLYVILNVFVSRYSCITVALTHNYTVVLIKQVQNHLNHIHINELIYCGCVWLPWDYISWPYSQEGIPHRNAPL